MPTFDAVWAKVPKLSRKSDKTRLAHFFLRLAPTEFGNVSLEDLFRHFETVDPNGPEYLRYMPNFAVVVAIAFTLGSLICFVTLLAEGISDRDETFLAISKPPKHLAVCREAPLSFTGQSVPLAHQYYVCQKTMRAVVLQQIAEAFSQAFLYAQIMWITAGLLIVKLIKYCEPKRDGVRRILTTLSKSEVEETYAAMKDATVLHAIDALQEQISELQRTLRGIPSLSASHAALPEEYSPSADTWDSPRNTKIREVMLQLHATHRDVLSEEEDGMLEKMCKILKLALDSSLIGARKPASSDAPDSSPQQRTDKSISRRLTEATIDAVEERCSTVRRNTSLENGANSADEGDSRVSSLSASPLHTPLEVEAGPTPSKKQLRPPQRHEPTSAALGPVLLSRGSLGAPEFTLNDAFGDAEEGCVTGERP